MKTLDEQIQEVRAAWLYARDPKKKARLYKELYKLVNEKYPPQKYVAGTLEHVNFD